MICLFFYFRGLKDFSLELSSDLYEWTEILSDSLPLPPNHQVACSLTYVPLTEFPMPPLTIGRYLALKVHSAHAGPKAGGDGNIKLKYIGVNISE